MTLRKCKMHVEVMSLTRWSLNKIRTYKYGKGFFWMGNRDVTAIDNNIKGRGDWSFYLLLIQMDSSKLHSPAKWKI